MADEITVTVGLRIEKGGVLMDPPASIQSITMSGSHAIHRTQAIGESAEALDIGEITNCGIIRIKNLHATKYVTIRMGESGADVVKLLAGEEFAFRLAGNTPYAIAETGATSCIVEYWLVEA